MFAVGYLNYKTGTTDAVSGLLFRIFYRTKDLRDSYIFNCLLYEINATLDDFMYDRERVLERIRTILMRRYIRLVYDRIIELIIQSRDVIDYVRGIFNTEFFHENMDCIRNDLFILIKAIGVTIMRAKEYDYIQRHLVVYEIYDIVDRPKHDLLDDLIKGLESQTSCLNEEWMDSLYFHCLVIFNNQLFNDDERRILFHAARKNISFRKDRLYVLFKAYYRDNKAINMLHQHLAFIIMNPKKFKDIMNDKQVLLEKFLCNAVIHAIKIHAKKYPNIDKFMIHFLLVESYKSVRFFENKDFFGTVLRAYLERFNTWDDAIKLFTSRNNLTLNRIIIATVFELFPKMTPDDKALAYKTIRTKKITNQRWGNENLRGRNVYKFYF